MNCFTMLASKSTHMVSKHRRRPGAEFGGNGKDFSETKFSTDPFLGKNSILGLTPKISDDFFLVIDLSLLSDMISYISFIIYNTHINHSFLDENVYFAKKIRFFCSYLR